MADKWMDPVAASILSAATKAGLSGKKMDQVTGYAWLASKNSQLAGMPVDDARKAFAKLDISAQDSLRAYFQDPEYSKSEPGLMGKAFDLAKMPFNFTMNVLQNYGEIVSSPYRALKSANSFSDFVSGKSWQEWKNGERQFDPEREKIVDSAYDPVMAKIAKRLAMGDKPGDIVGDFTTVQEENAWDKFVRGDADMMNAIRDYHDAKISPGRDWARLIGLEPNVAESDQGIEAGFYKMISGGMDLIASLVMDPAVWIAAPFTAVKNARYGVMAMLSAETGSLTRTQKALNALGGMKFGVDAAFEIPKVRTAFDSIGPNLAVIGSKKSTLAAKSAAMDAVRTAFPAMTDRAILYMSQNGVKDAETARTFFKDSALAEDIMLGRVGSMQAMLPTYSASNKVRSALRMATQVAFGERETALKTAGKEDTLLSTLQSGGSLSTIMDIKNLKVRRDLFARITDRALLRNYVNVEGDGVIDSAADVYSLARTFLGRPQARLVSNAFMIAPDAASRRQIIIGLYDNLGEYLGVKTTEAGAKAWTDELGRIKNAQYSNDMVVDVNTARAIGVKSGQYDPSMIDNVSRATSVNQTTERMALPKLQNLLDLQERRINLRSVSNTVNNRFIQSVTDFWSAANLLPRLGIRSVLDETLFHSLTLPVALFPTFAKGYLLGVTGRIVRGTEKRTTVQFGDLGERDLGIVARTFSKWFANVDQQTIRAAMKDRNMQADLMQQQVLNSRFGKMLKVTKNYEKDAKYISDLNRYALTRTLDDFSSGATAGIVNTLPAESLFDDFAEYANLNIDAAMEDIGKRFGGDLREISHTEPEFAVNMLMQLAFRVDGNGQIGKIATRYMDRPKKAVLEIKKYLQTAEGQKVYARFDRSRIKGRSLDMDARDFYLNVRGMFVDDAGNLNKALLDKVRRVDDKGQELISTTQLTVDDLGEAAVAKMLPRRTLGYGFRVPKVNTFAEYLDRIINRGFQVADRQVGTLTRTPVYNAYYLGYRRQFAPLEQKFIAEQMKRNGMTRTAAENMAARRYAELADNMAINRAIGYIDNPNVRSVSAYGMRNLARYYRATEDFYRRAMRVAANTPNALVRMRMASESLDHAGFIHKDEQGERYFVFPTDTIMYGLTAPMIKAITGEWPKQPMPLKLTGKLKMITPSVDMSSNIPTFSGPMAAVAWGVLSNLLGGFGGKTGQNIVENVDTAFFGKYAENQNFLDMMLPMSFRRIKNLWDVGTENEANAQYMSAYMKSVAYYSANPQYKMPDGTSSLSDIAQAKYDLRATAFNIVFLRNLMGIFSPVSPTLREGVDVPKWMEAYGVKTMRGEFRDILNREFQKGTENAYEEALRKYTRLYPGRLAYTVSETEMNTVATVKKTKDAVSWIQKNTDLIKMFPEGSLFLMPQINQYDMDSYMFLKREGYIQSKTLEQYAAQIATVQDENTYYDIKNSAEKAAAEDGTATGAKIILAQADARASEFLASRPYLQQQMVGGGAANIMKQMVLDDTRKMLDSGMAPQNTTTGLLCKMIATFDSAKTTLDSVDSQSDTALAYKRALRADVSQQLKDMAGTNPNAIEFYNTILKRLIEK